MRQGSDEWKEFRRNHIGSSDAYKIWNWNENELYDLWEEKCGLRTNDFDNDAMRHGRETEPLARKWFKKYIKESVIWPDVKEDDEYKFLSASVDGINLSRTILCEIKCPVSRGILLKAQEDDIDEKHYAQMQHQMQVYGLDKVYYVIYFSDDDAHVFECLRSNEWIDIYLGKCHFFWKMVEEKTPPIQSRTDNKFKEVEKDLYDIIVEETRLKKELKAIQDRKEDFMDEMELITDGRSVMGERIIFTKSSRKGNIDYDRINEMKNLDLESYRKEPSIFWSAKIRKN